MDKRKNKMIGILEWYKMTDKKGVSMESVTWGFQSLECLIKDLGQISQEKNEPPRHSLQARYYCTRKRTNVLLQIVDTISQKMNCRTKSRHPMTTTNSDHKFLNMISEFQSPGKNKTDKSCLWITASSNYRPWILYSLFSTVFLRNKVNRSRKTCFQQAARAWNHQTRVERMFVQRCNPQREGTISLLFTIIKYINESWQTHYRSQEWTSVSMHYVRERFGQQSTTVTDVEK